MDDESKHPWKEDCAHFGRRDRRKPLPVLTPQQADNLALSIERLEQRRSYNRIGGVDEDFDQ